MLLYINGATPIIKRYKGTQLIFDSTASDVADNCDGSTISFAFTGDTLEFKLDYNLVGVKTITATTSPYSSSLIDLGFTRLYPYKMFYECENLTTVTCLPNMSNAVLSDSMFGYCSGLTNVDINDWVFKPTQCGSMFSNCPVLTSVTTTNWDMSSNTNISYMFSVCPKLSTIKDIKKWNTSGVTTMNYIFNGCTSLITMDLSGWNTSSLKTANSMFYGCSALTSVNLSGWDMSNVTNCSGIFNGCTSLQTIDITGWDISHITTPTYYSNMFENCTSLNKLILGETSQGMYDIIVSLLNEAGITSNVTIEYTIV